MTTSCQPRPQPQANGIDAIRASIGTPTNRPTRIRCAIELGASSKSGRAGTVLAAPLMTFVPRASGVGDMVLLGISAPGGSLIRLRNRSLRHRRLCRGPKMNICESEHESRLRAPSAISTSETALAAVFTVDGPAVQVVSVLARSPAPSYANYAHHGCL